ncbi:hypothetical protein BT69DRAFT_759621 [Atractiella rhizophila]|nr:hypothetical protein BT69DRAFT_759621 [Atractiella rhizophila]
MSSVPSTPFVAQTLDSILAPSTSTRTQRGHSRPSSHVPDQDRLRQQRTEAAEIMRNLGLGSSQTTPQKSPRKKEEGTARPSRVVSQGERSRPASSASNVSSLVSHSALEKRAEDQEYLISTLRAQISGLTNERNALKVEVAKLKEGGGKTTLQAREVEELTRQFAAQEKLLEGYQKENEKCMVTIEELRKKTGKGFMVKL